MLSSLDGNYLVTALSNAVIVSNLWVPPPNLASLVGQMNQTLALLETPSASTAKTNSKKNGINGMNAIVMNLDNHLERIVTPANQREEENEVIPFDERISNNWNRGIESGNQI